MNITISGIPGSGKSTVAGIVAKELGMRHVSIGDILRELAESKGLTILEISKMAEKDRKIDIELDNRQKALAKQNNLVIDSRLGFHFVPKSFKVFLDVSPEEAGRRIFNARRLKEKENVSLEKTMENIKRRKLSEGIRYKKCYNVNPFDLKNYDLVIDTTKLSPEKVAAKIIAEVKSN